MDGSVCKHIEKRVNCGRSSFLSIFIALLSHLLYAFSTLCSRVRFPFENVHEATDRHWDIETRLSFLCSTDIEFDSDATA